MRIHNMLAKFLAAFALLTIASISQALPLNYGGTFSASKFNNAGTVTTVMRPNASYFCYLSSISIEETDSGGEEATCRVRRSGTVWILEARLDKSSDADAECQAICYTSF